MSPKGSDALNDSQNPLEEIEVLVGIADIFKVDEKKAMKIHLTPSHVFWSRWRREYLPMLQLRRKCAKHDPQCAEGRRSSSPLQRRPNE